VVTDRSLLTGCPDPVNRRLFWFRNTLLASLNQAEETIAPVETDGVVSWCLI
jgi:hypothetical protein